MALGTPSQVGTQTSQTSGQTSVAVASVVIPANSHVAVEFMAANGGVAVGDPTRVNDNNDSTGATGNNYTKDVSAVRTTNDYTSRWTFYDATGGTRNFVIPLPASANITYTRIWTTSGVATSSQLDQTGTGSSSSTAVALGTNGTLPGATTQADEICWFGYSWGSATTPTTQTPTGYTTLGSQTNATRLFSVAYAYKILSATSTETPTATLAGSNAWAAIFSSYKAAATAAFVQPNRRAVQAVKRAAFY